MAVLHISARVPRATAGTPAGTRRTPRRRGSTGSWRPRPSEILRTFTGWHYLANATCLTRPHSLYAVCVFRRVKDHHNLLDNAPFVKKSCVRQVVLDKASPLNIADF